MRISKSDVKEDWDESTLYHNIKCYVLNGMLTTIVIAFYKPLAQKFISRLGGTAFHISLYNSLPGLIAFLTTIPGIIFLSRTTKKKYIIAGSFFMSRIFILLFAFVPLLPDEYKPITFVLLVGFMNFPESVSNTAMQSFSADIFSGNDLSAAITSRNKYSALVNFSTALILGQIITLLGHSEKKIIELYQIFFITAFIISTIEIAMLCKIKEIKAPSKEKIDIKILPEVFKNKIFMKFMVCSLLFHFGWQLGWPIFSVYQIEYLKANEAWLSIISVSSGLMMFASSGLWRKMIINKGNQYCIAFAAVGMAMTPVLFVLSPNLYIMTGVGIITGFFTAGTVVTILNSLLETSPDQNRIMYVAVHSALTNLTLFAAPLVGNIIYKNTNIYTALYACAVFRFIGSFAFILRNKKESQKSIEIFYNY